MQKRVYHNDGDDLELAVTMTAKNGTITDPSDIDWQISLYSDPAAALHISCIGGKTNGCTIENGKIRIRIDGHRFGPGMLLARAWYRLPNNKFKDGTQDVSSLPTETGIIIT